jgi:hypothetical protein
MPKSNDQILEYFSKTRESDQFKEEIEDLVPVISSHNVQDIVQTEENVRSTSQKLVGSIVGVFVVVLCAVYLGTPWDH